MLDIKVDDSNAKVPKVTFSKTPFQVHKTTVNVLKQGTGAAVGGNQIAVVNYTVVNGVNGQTIANTFNNTHVLIYLKDPTQFPGLVTALKGAKVGTTETVAVPPADGFGSQGNSQYGVSATDTLIFYINVQSATTPLPGASGATVSPQSAFPTVKMEGTSKPATITVPNSAAPKSLESENLINGIGAIVKKGQTIFAQYTGVIWSNGKVFDSTGLRDGLPTGFLVGVGQVIPAWDKVLVDKRVGDRVLMVVPPADGYGKKGNQHAGISGTDTLVFVIDIVAAV